MKLSRDWLSDYIDLKGLSEAELASRFTEIGHAVDSVEKHGHDTVFDLEITTNRVDAMSHLGMARELSAALEEVLFRPGPFAREGGGEGVTIRIEAPDMCARYTGLVIRGVKVGPSPAHFQRRLEAVGLRPINNVVDATNYVMMALGHPLHAFDLDKLATATIIVRRGIKGEKMRSLDGEMRDIDPDTVVIADAKKAVALGGIIGGAESEISSSTRNVLLECAWFNPSVIRRTARRLGLKTDASYRFERRVDPNDTVEAIHFAARCIVDWGGGKAEPVIDVVAQEIKPTTLRLRAPRLQEASAGVVAMNYALDIFIRLGFSPTQIPEGLEVIVPTYRGDIHEEADLIEEVLRFFGLDKVPSALPRLTTGDTRPNVAGDAEDAIRQILVGCGLTEVVNYSFIHPDYNSMFSSEQPVAVTNALSENIGAMRLSMIPGLLESVVYNRSYGTRDGALFEVGRTYHRAGDVVHENHRIGLVMYGPVDFFDLKGAVEAVAEKFHVPLTVSAGDRIVPASRRPSTPHPKGRRDAGTTRDSWLKKGKRAVARHGDREIAALGYLSSDILQRFGIKGDVLAAEIDVDALLESTGEWKMTQVPRFPGVPMILAMTHARDLEYQRVIATIRSLNVPYLHEVGLRDRFVPEGQDVVKTTLGMWYQAFDRSLTQEEVGQLHNSLASKVADLLPVKLLEKS